MHHETAYWLQFFQNSFSHLNAVKDDGRRKAIDERNQEMQNNYLGKNFVTRK